MAKSHQFSRFFSSKIENQLALQNDRQNLSFVKYIYVVGKKWPNSKVLSFESKRSIVEWNQNLLIRSLCPSIARWLILLIWLICQKTVKERAEGINLEIGRTKHGPEKKQRKGAEKDPPKYSNKYVCTQKIRYYTRKTGEMITEGRETLGKTFQRKVDCPSLKYYFRQKVKYSTVREAKGRGHK